MALTNRQQVFVEEYLRCWNATEAARRAGYSENSIRSIAAENLTKPDIKAYIDARLGELKMSADEVMVRVTDIARGSMADFLDDERQTLDLAKADRAGKLHLVKKFSHTVTDKSENISIELYGADAALALLGKHHKLFVERTEHTGADGGAVPLEIILRQVPARASEDT